eukprot:CAMPEP_0113685044 /NCGR_PEP_ID=MMETSP0038_2-20120614/14407_1 /TAXON_ID=2898 /ORGANISM="Cryptomonas paramecium" /LENGTH=743 /DNA_ID=CAMNT_0000604995 /DNA_START=167 /DNA_END=2395 /DNA_ORIENTATION=- /assembly_acc=CAM_ASM_000170
MDSNTAQSSATAETRPANLSANIHSASCPHMDTKLAPGPVELANANPNNGATNNQFSRTRSSALSNCSVTGNPPPPLQSPVLGAVAVNDPKRRVPPDFFQRLSSEPAACRRSPDRQDRPAPSLSPTRRTTRMIMPSTSFNNFRTHDGKAKSVDPDRRLEDLLKKLHYKLKSEDLETLQNAFGCSVCQDGDAPCHQIRAVREAFDLAWSEERGSSGVLRMWDLEAFVSKCELGEDFLNRLKQALSEKLSVGPDEAITADQFLLGFAHVLLALDEDARAHYYRVFWRMFGMEMTKQKFRWNKFMVAGVALNLAPISDLMCWIERRFGPSRFLTNLLSAVRGGSRKLDVMEADSKAKTQKGALPVHKILMDATWLPLGYNSFKHYQAQMRMIWLPALIAGLIYLCFSRHMPAVSAAEPLCPMVLYSLIASIVSTTAGFEHRGLVTRRKYVLAGESTEEEFRAAFAFRSHTPEGHLVEKIELISQVCEVGRWRSKCQQLSMLVAVMHGMTPALHRAFFQFGKGPNDLLMRGLWVAMGVDGTSLGDLAAALVALPCAVLSGFCIYELMLMATDIFYNDLCFLYKLKLLKACTTPAYYLVYRRKWTKVCEKDKNLQHPWTKRFMDFMSLQEIHDLTLWCRVRQLLIDSALGFKAIQRDVVLTYTLLVHLFLTFSLIAKHYDAFLKPSKEALKSISLVDVWTLLDCSIFTVVLCVVMYNKLIIYDMRRRDIKLLHDEYYRAGLLAHSQQS